MSCVWCEWASESEGACMLVDGAKEVTVVTTVN